MARNDPVNGAALGELADGHHPVYRVRAVLDVDLGRKAVEEKTPGVDHLDFAGVKGRITAYTGKKPFDPAPGRKVQYAGADMDIISENDLFLLGRITTTPFGTNAYILVCRETRESVLVDAPGEAERILRALEETKPVCILLTHGHPDHTGALADLKETLGLPVGLHAADENALPVPGEMLLGDGNIISFGKVTLDVLHTPGHTPGSLSFLAGDCLISGDTLFPGGPGKSGSPEAFRRILDSIRNKILPLPDKTGIFPGHGQPTSLGKERGSIERFLSRRHDSSLCGDVLWERD